MFGNFRMVSCWQAKLKWCKSKSNSGNLQEVGRTAFRCTACVWIHAFFLHLFTAWSSCGHVGVRWMESYITCSLEVKEGGWRLESQGWCPCVQHLISAAVWSFNCTAEVWMWEHWWFLLPWRVVTSTFYVLSKHNSPSNTSPNNANELKEVGLN